MPLKFLKIMKRLLLLYFPLDDPEIINQDKVIELYLKHHVTTIEVALPVSNPFLDGPTITDSMRRIEKIKDTRQIFEDIALTKNKFPSLEIQVMAYSALIKEIGIDDFSDLLIKSGASYILSPDAEEKLLCELENKLVNSNVSVIRFAPYIIDNNNVKTLINSKGYIFQRSTDGKTGKLEKFPEHLRKNIKIIRENNIETPVVIGFGISNEEHVKQVFDLGADGAVIGSALFSHIKDGSLDDYLEQFDKYYE